MRTRVLVLVGLLVALVLAGGVSYYASASPDGLEKVAEDKGFLDSAADHDLADSPVADYSVRGVDDARLSGGLAGVLGVLTTLAVGGVLFTVVSRRRRSADDARDTAEPSGSPARR
jgi:PDGLE domain